MSKVKALFVLATLSLGTRALAQDSLGDLVSGDASFVYADVDGSGTLDELFLSVDARGDVTVGVTYDVPEERADAYSSSSLDRDLVLEIASTLVGEGEDRSASVDRDRSELSDWTEIGGAELDRGDFAPDVEFSYSAGNGVQPGGPIWYPWGPQDCYMVCDLWYGWTCLRAHYVCG